MAAPLMEERIDRELRRQQLVRRLLVHQARTQTICELTTLSRHQLVTLRERWRVTQEMRYRGPSPKSFLSFLSSSRSRSEGAALASVCRILGALPPSEGTTSTRAAPMETGEKLCDVYEAYEACLPRAEANFDRLALLARGLAQGDAIGLSLCARCECAILIDRLGSERLLCSHCQGTAAPAHDRLRDEAALREADARPADTGEGVQQELF